MISTTIATADEPYDASPPHIDVPAAIQRGHLHLAGAATLVDYLWDLGISDVYASPLFRARQQSRSGYDVIDHNAIDPELGTEADLAALGGLLRAREMGLLLDVVPNHMGVDDANNSWWQDVLEHGRNSPYAHFFDIDWEPPKTVLQGRIVLPVLGDQYGNVLERGELKLAYDGQRFLISYYHRTFPIAARTWPKILQSALERHLSLPPDDSARMELESIVTSLVHQPAAGPADRESIRAARREEEVARRRLAALLEANLAVQEAISTTLSDFNGRAGDPRSFDPLEALLAEQTYRLCYWRVAADEINYRRFFDINRLRWPPCGSKIPTYSPLRTKWSSAGWSGAGLPVCASTIPTDCSTPSNTFSICRKATAGWCPMPPQGPRRCT